MGVLAELYDKINSHSQPCFSLIPKNILCENHPLSQSRNKRLTKLKSDKKNGSTLNQNQIL